MHQSTSLQIYSDIISQDSQHDGRALQSWAKNKTTRKFQRNQTQTEVLQTCIFSEIVFCLNIFYI